MKPIDSQPQRLLTRLLSPVGLALASLLLTGCLQESPKVAGQAQAGQPANTTRDEVAQRGPVAQQLPIGNAQAEYPLKYIVPRNPQTQASSAARWGVAAPIVEGPVVDGFSNPNLIAYDEPLVQAHVAFAINTPTRCGETTYTLRTPEGNQERSGGLDETYLGTMFDAEQLVRFLKHRVNDPGVEQTSLVKDPAEVQALQENYASLSHGFIGMSPWDHDVASAINVLALVPYEAALEPIRQLVHDRNGHVRYCAVMGLGRLAEAQPAALTELRNLLIEEEPTDADLPFRAADALRMVLARDPEKLMKFLQDEHAEVRSTAVSALGGVQQLADVLSAWEFVLTHQDSEMRRQGMSVMLDAQTRGLDYNHPRIVTLVEKIESTPDELDQTRRLAQTVLANLRQQ